MIKLIRTIISNYFGAIEASRGANVLFGYINRDIKSAFTKSDNSEIIRISKYTTADCGLIVFPVF